MPGRSVMVTSLLPFSFPSFFSTVTPGQFPTNCAAPVRALNMVVLPQFEMCIRDSLLRVAGHLGMRIQKGTLGIAQIVGASLRKILRIHRYLKIFRENIKGHHSVNVTALFSYSDNRLVIDCICINICKNHITICFHSLPIPFCFCSIIILIVFPGISSYNLFLQNNVWILSLIHISRESTR